MSEQAVPINR